MHNLTHDEVNRLFDEGAEFTLINVLDREAFEAEHIPGSVNVPVSQADFVTQVEKKVGGKDRQIVVYCAGPECPASEVAARKLTRAGFTDVHRFTGGMEEWKQAGLPIESKSD